MDKTLRSISLLAFLGFLPLVFLAGCKCCQVTPSKDPSGSLKGTTLGIGPLNDEGGTNMKSSMTEGKAVVEDSGVEPLFKAVLQYRSDSPADTVVSAKGKEGSLIGSGDGTIKGPKFNGKIRWSLWAGDCLYPLIRKGQKVPDDMHLCTMNPVGFIEMGDGTTIRFEGRGYGLRRPEKYRTCLTLVFSTDDPRYAWLTKVLGLMDGEFDEKSGRAFWNVFIPMNSRS